MKKLIIILVLLVNKVYCQKCDYTIVDSKVNSSQYKTHNIQNIEELTEYLNKFATTDLGRCRVYYTWITNNITYDRTIKETDEYKSYGNIYQKAIYVSFPKRRATCSEYSIIFKTMCDYSNIPCLAIAGGIPNSVGHAWNMVKINNKSYVIDCCWGTVNNDINFLIDFNVFNNEYKQFYEHRKETDPNNFLFGIYLKNIGFVGLSDKNISKIESDMINIDFEKIITSKNINYVISSSSTNISNTNTKITIISENDKKINRLNDDIKNNEEIIHSLKWWKKLPLFNSQMKSLKAKISIEKTELKKLKSKS